MSRDGDRDPTAVRAELVGLKEPERRKRAKAAQEAFDRALRDRPSPAWQVAAIEWAGTATARKISSDFWRLGFEPESYAEIADDLYAVMAARGRSFFQTFARLAVREEFGATWPLVRRAVREGLIEPPDGDDYIRRLVVSLGARGGMRELDATYAELLADPGLLDDAIWQLFEVDVAAELTNSTTWEPPTAGQTGGRGENRWLYALTRLAGEGRLDRARLLDASLDALLRDFRASSVGWYAKLHESLGPTPEERVQRLDRYLSLVTSPTPAVAREGLAALRSVEEHVPPDAFARVAPTPFSQRQKHLSTETLSLLAALCKRHPSEQPVLLDAAVHALGHERTDVQERALKLLEQHTDAVPRAQLLGYVDAVSATLRPRVEALTGVEAPRGTPAARETEVPEHRPADAVHAEPPPLERVATLDELIELAATLVEGSGDGDDCERFLDGVSRLCDERPPPFGRRTAGLAKRAEAAGYWGPMASGSELVAYVVRAWTGRRHRFERIERSHTVMGFLVGRAEEVARRASHRRPRSLLAFPTSSGGAIDPAVLEERLRRTGRFRNRPDPLDETQARARAFRPVEPLWFERRVGERTRWGTGRYLRLHAPSVPAALGALAPLAQNAGALDDDRAWFGGATKWAGFDRLASAWALTVLPSLPEVAFAGAATVAVAARDGTDTSSGHPEAVLEQALVRPLPLPPVAWLTVASCLLARSPGVTRVATDLLVATVEDGRFDAAALGREIAWLVDNDLAKIGRLEASLRDAARISPVHALRTLRTVEAVLARLDTRPRALHTLLDVAAESAASSGGRVEDERARDALTAIATESSRSSKLGRLARSLVEA